MEISSTTKIEQLIDLWIEKRFKMSAYKFRSAYCASVTLQHINKTQNLLLMDPELLPEFRGADGDPLDVISSIFNRIEEDYNAQQ